MPKGREPYGNGAAVVVRDGENPSHGEGRQVDWNGRETWVSVMLNAHLPETIQALESRMQ